MDIFGRKKIRELNKQIRGLSNKLRQEKARNETKENIIDDLQDLIHKLRDGNERNLDDFINRIFAEDISWYAVEDLTRAQQKTYRQEAMKLLDNPVWKNETNHLCQIMAQRAIENADSLEDLKDRQATLAAVWMIKGRLESLATQEKRETPMTEDEKFEAI